jgi:uncharacterized protein YndB with AHSA1/START domain
MRAGRNFEPINYIFPGTILLFLALLTTRASSESRMDTSEKLAANGQIQENAPVKASVEIVIDASPEKVWRFLTDIDQWPTWQSAISAARIDGPLEPGTTFVWTNGGPRIKSRIAIVHPAAQLAWTGTTFGAKAIHVWSLELLPAGGTHVKTTESIDGFMLRMGLFYSSNDLAKSLKEWLEALKRKAEQ